MKRVTIIGGGASGFFSAINIKEQNPQIEVTILEKGRDVLQKLKISGGGRCNVTHACFDPAELVRFYPRGQKELLGAFYKFMTGDVFEWFERHGVGLKIEEDGRAFPATDSSQTIIDCYTELAKKLGVKVLTDHRVHSFYPEAETWVVETNKGQFVSDKLIVASGSSRHIWKILEGLDCSIVAPVPSLFTFHIKDPRIRDLAGVSVPNARVKLLGTKLENSGPVLITHWGLSGPAILRLSAFGAVLLAEKDYVCDIEVNWLSRSYDEVLDELLARKEDNPRKSVGTKSPFEGLTKRLWASLLLAADIDHTKNWADISKTKIQHLVEGLTKCTLHVKGKSIFKDEFVTAGGAELKEINFKNFEHRKHPGLHILGEALNIDAVTGGFNFQNAWTTAYICADYIAHCDD